MPVPNEIQIECPCCEGTATAIKKNRNTYTIQHHSTPEGIPCDFQLPEELNS